VNRTLLESLHCFPDLRLDIGGQLVMGMGMEGNEKGTKKKIR